MNTAELRLAAVKRLIEDRFDGALAKFARAIDRDESQVWAFVKGARNIGERLARHIETALNLEPGTLDRPGPYMVAEPVTPPYAPARGVPVVGTAQLGTDGYYDELGYPAGHGDGFIAYPTRDPNAYALRVKGDSMRPRIKHGEFVLVEPNTPPQPGDEVVVRTHSGRAMVKVLDFRRGGVVQLSSVNENHERITLDETDIERLHTVGAIVKPALYYRDHV